MLYQPLLRPLLTLTTASTVMVCILCFALVLSSQRSHDHLLALAGQLVLLSEFEQSARNALGTADVEPSTAVEIALARLDAGRQRLENGAGSDVALAFSADDAGARDVASRRARMVDALVEESRIEWWLVVSLAACLGAGSLGLNWQLRRHVLRPLETINRLISTLSRRRYERADTEGVPTAIRPLFESYNDLVTRVARSQERQAEREAELRAELNDATRALMQQQLTLMREQRIAASGELAAQVAHDMRNPLAGILAAVENLRRETTDADHAERLQLVGDEVRRLSRQFDRLLEATRQRPEQARWVDVRTVTESMLSLASYQLPPGIEFACSICPDLRMRLPESGFRNALLNLLINAAHAMEEHPGSIEVASTRDDDRIVIAVRDTGPGFSEEALRSGARSYATFTPGGSGLGLAAVRRYVTDLGGGLELSNRPGGGAEVQMKFPAESRDG